MTRLGAMPRNLFLLALLGLTACASAEKRLEQGRELETAGRFEAAVGRYVEALQKDPELVEARERLAAVGDSAVVQRLSNVRALRSRGDYVGASDQYRAVDGLVSRARSVGVRLAVPADYRQARRQTFDDAFDGVMERGWAAVDRGRWEDGVQDFRAAREHFEPSAEQHAASVEAESGALLGWSNEALSAGQLRLAFDAANRVQHLGHAPPDHTTQAVEIMNTALAQGEVEVMVLPVVAPMTRPGRGGGELLPLEIEVNDQLDRTAWRSPPPFVRLADPVRVREIVRRAAVLGGGLRAPAMGLLLELVESDYGVWMELLNTDVMEFDLEQRVRNARTRDGRATTFTVESGQRRIRAEARVLVVDRSGNPLTDLVVVGTGTGPFERGVYEGNPSDLNLDRRQVDWFDRLVLEAQDAAIRNALAANLADQLAGAVFDPVLARIP
ncbi:MAG TPA: hypothetical protein VK858_17340 [Longimicrobiales bacterium]|nr:hypothetical protein [Longimicrobiales bacterium]